MSDYFDWFFGPVDDTPRSPFSPIESYNYNLDLPSDVETQINMDPPQPRQRGEQQGRGMGPRQAPPSAPPPGQQGRGIGQIPGRRNTEPPGAPPGISPQVEMNILPRAVDPGAIRGCLYRFTLVRLNNGQRFWMWPTFVGPRSVAGYRWNGRRWVYFGIDLRRIASFRCF